MAEQASAWVTLIPTARGFGRATERALDGELPQVGDRQGRGLGNRLSGAFGGVLKAGVIGASAAAGAAIGTTLFKGFQRLDAIDQAKAKLTGLGHSAATVNQVMDNALKAVKGTAFGLDEAATTAAGAIAAGVKPGQQLQRTLGLVADAATIGGTSMGEMGSIFNKVAATGKIQGDVLAQLGDRGIPILQLLGKELGKTPAQVAELASQGKIDFATFQDAMESGLGGAALESGKTFSGAFKNMGAAVGRLGASVLSGVFPKLQGTFTKLTGLIDKAGPGAERFGKVLGDGFSKAATFIGPVVKAIGGLFSGGAGSEQMTQFITTLTSVFESVKSIVSSAISIITSLWQRFGGTLTTFVVAAFENVLQVIRGAFEIIRGIFQVVSSLLKGDWQGVWDGLKTIVSGAWEVIKGLVGLGWAAITGLFKLAGTTLKAIFVGIWNGLKSAAVTGWNAAWGFIKTIPDKLKGLFSGIWSGISTGLKTAINTVLHLPLKIPTITVKGIGEIGGQTLIPRLASGGIVTSPTVALLGESGAEAIVPLTGAHGRRAAAAGWSQPDSIRPVYMDGSIVAVLREMADRRAELIFNQQAFQAGVVA